MTKYRKSEEFLKRAEEVIPLGSQTFSKSRTQYPVGISPLFASRAKGPYLWDLDLNKYIDLVSGLASITLGYKDKKFTRYVKKQVSKGVNFSLPGILECEVAEKIISMVPGAEMVRFGKNGSDVTSAAIRLARSFTNRDHVVVCGYHGWHDWYIGTTSKNSGVPETISKITHKFEYNNLESLQKLFQEYPHKIAAVIMEPMNKDFPENNFLQQVKEITNKNGALLIFDEVITGFRFSRGGAQEIFGVNPDLSTFGKGLANGFPISAIVGKKEIMKGMEEIFFSGTFGGELVSLSAANYVLGLHQENLIVPRLNEIGAELATVTNDAITRNQLSEIFNLSGHDTWKFLNIKATENHSVEVIKTYFMQEIFKRGLLTVGTHNVTLSHKSKVIHKISEIYDDVFSKINNGIKKDSLKNDLLVDPLKPLFKVR
jgi:glutamate-1-semialdehyde 2,1-aminomutase